MGLAGVKAFLAAAHEWEARVIYFVDVIRDGGDFYRSLNAFTPVQENGRLSRDMVLIPSEPETRQILEGKIGPIPCFFPLLPEQAHLQRSASQPAQKCG